MRKTELNAEQIQDSFAIQKSKGQPYREHRPGKEFLTSSCHGLVIIDPEKETLSLVHKSVKTNLQKPRKPPIIADNADLEMAKTCLLYLLVDPCDHEDEPPLLQYAAKYWRAHLSSCGDKVDVQEADSLTLSFLGSSPKLARAFEAMDGAHGGAFDHMTGLHAAVHYDLPGWVERVLESGVDVNARCADGQTALPTGRSGTADTRSWSCS